MMAGRIDLTVGFGIVMWHILAISLQVQYGVPWPVACLRRRAAAAALVGLSTACSSRSRRSTPSSPRSAPARSSTRSRSGTPTGARSSACCRRASSRSTRLSILGMPIAGVYVLVLALVLWIVSERLPLGRYLYAIGANEKAAALNGIPVRAYVIGVFVASGADRRLRRLRARREAPDRPGQRRPRFPAAGAGRRLPRLDHDQARPGQCLGHDLSAC